MVGYKGQRSGYHADIQAKSKPATAAAMETNQFIRRVSRCVRGDNVESLLIEVIFSCHTE